MGQYWIVVNLDKREFVYPHRLGTGLKLVEQLESHAGSALIVLCAAMPEPRGGGDFDLDENWHGPERTFPKYNSTPGPMSKDYPAIARAVIGRWAGDRIALVGDYAESGDLAPEHQAHLIYHLCHTEEERRAQVQHLQKYARGARERGGSLYGRTAEEYEREADELEKAALYTDVSDLVARVIEHELCGRFEESVGWRSWIPGRR